MKKALIMGSLVLDITPSLRSDDLRTVEDIFVQGKVTELKDVSFYMGGCVGNTGLALHKLGVDTTLCGKVGEDFAGSAIELLIRQAGIPFRMSKMPGVPTTIGIAITPPGLDKITLFLRGASQEYDSSDVRDLPDTDLFHFGYPVTMKRLYANEGEELVKMYRTVHEAGVTTSLDTALPRPESEPGQVVWKPILKKLLPYVDIFVPSFEECLFMLDRESYIRRYQQTAGTDLLDSVSADEVRAVAQKFLDMGVKVVLLKIGSKGMYLRTAGEEKLRQARRVFGDCADKWADRELWIFPNRVDKIVSTTGAGDVGIAGFLSTALRQEDPVTALQVASTASWLCIQSSDTTSKLVPWEELAAMGAVAERPVRMELPEDRWRYDPQAGVYLGSCDRNF